MKKHKKTGALRYFHQKDKGTIILSNQEVEFFSKIIEELIKSDKILNNFTIMELEKLLEDTLLRIFQDKKTPLEIKIKKEIEIFKKNIKDDIENWTFIIPIENFILDKRKLRIGKVVFYTFTNFQFTKWKTKYKEHLKNIKKLTNSKRDEFLLKFSNEFIDPLKNCLCAEVTISGKFNRAYELALHEVRKSLSAITLFFLPSDDYNNLKIGIKGEIIKSVYRSDIGFNSNLRFGRKFGYHGAHYPLKLDQERIKSMYASGLGKISKLLSKEQHNPFEQRLIYSIYWFGSALNIQLGMYSSTEDKKIIPKREHKIKGYETLEYHLFGERLIKLMIALETLVIRNEREPIITNIGERIAFLVEKDWAKRQSIDRLIKKLYRLRSKNIHHGKVLISYQELIWLADIIRSAILKLVINQKRYSISNDDEFFNWFDKQKFR